MSQSDWTKEWNEKRDSKFYNSFTYKVLEELVKTNDNKTLAAKNLGISRQYVHKILRRYQELGKTGIAYAQRGIKYRMFRQISNDQFCQIREIVEGNDASSMNVPYRGYDWYRKNSRYRVLGWKVEYVGSGGTYSWRYGSVYRRGWYSSSVIELVKQKYDIEISYATANRILEKCYFHY